MQLLVDCRSGHPSPLLYPAPAAARRAPARPARRAALPRPPRTPNHVAGVALALAAGRPLLTVNVQVLAAAPAPQAQLPWSPSCASHRRLPRPALAAALDLLLQPARLLSLLPLLLQPPLGPCTAARLLWPPPPKPLHPYPPAGRGVAAPRLKHNTSEAQQVAAQLQRSVAQTRRSAV